LAAGESNPHVANHEAMNHSAQMLEKMAFVKNGGNRNDIPEPLRPKTGDIRKYIRYNSNKPAVCITGDMRKVFHYEQNRALTVRELAALQSFPDNFIFCGSKIAQQQQVGNAVPPLLAKAIAESILKMSENE
ncbi:TPA: DNA cytosine methyltransferase, partial [Neisseria gonorrhoeae]